MIRQFRQPELMDDPALQAEDHRSALQGLARINQVSGTAKQIWSALRQHLKPGDEVDLLDVAAGGADVPLAVAKLAMKNDVKIRLSVCDISERALVWAGQRADALEVPLRTFVIDICEEDIPISHQIVTSSLFLHHLDIDQAQQALVRMSRAASDILLVNDLDRSVTGYLAACVASKLVTRSPIVHTDAARSVRAAYKRQEIASIAENAGLPHVRVRRCRPFRWQLMSTSR